MTKTTFDKWLEGKIRMVNKLSWTDVMFGHVVKDLVIQIGREAYEMGKKAGCLSSKDKMAKPLQDQKDVRNKE